MFPTDCPYTTLYCQDFILQLLQEKPCRLSSYKYREQDQHVDLGMPSAQRKFVFAEDDAVEIKAHRWFRGIDWENLHRVTPGFTPYLCGAGDTRYFEEDEPVSDWSASEDRVKPIEALEKIRKVFRHHGYSTRSIRSIMGSFSQLNDALGLRQIEQTIEGFTRLTDNSKGVIKHYARTFGRKENKRPRDILLRDKGTVADVMEVRKQTAFLAYIWLKPPPPPVVPTLQQGAPERARRHQSGARLAAPYLSPFGRLPPPPPSPGPMYQGLYSYNAYYEVPDGQRYWPVDGQYDYLGGGYHWTGGLQ